ncbi:MAG: hypothetical protein HY225_01850 [Candidatus Vogelbacteria bacterium]|nr:hypothetical protein [Candidatus Vogelbacteria bacterium]
MALDDWDFYVPCSTCGSHYYCDCHLKEMQRLRELDKFYERGDYERNKDKK